MSNDPSKPTTKGADTKPRTAPGGSGADKRHPQQALIDRINASIARGDYRNKDLAAQADMSHSHLSNFRGKRRILPTDKAHALETAHALLVRQTSERLPVRKHLLGQVRSQFAYIDLRFMQPKQVQQKLGQVSMQEVYVEPTLVPVTDPTAPSGYTPNEILALLVDGDRKLLHIVAPSGSGKTSCVRALVASTEVEKTYDRFPVAYPLGALNSRLGAKGTGSDGDLLEHIIQWYDNHEEHDVGAEIRRQVEAGVALLLLDGLDEVTNNQARRTRAVSLINAFSAKNASKGNLVVVTERGAPPFGRLDRLGRSIAYTFKPFGTDEAKQLIHNWYAVLADEEESEEAARSRDKLCALVEKEPFDKLVHTPLFLTLVTVLYITEGTLVGPASAPIFRRFFDLAMDIWRYKRSLDDSSVPPDVEETSERELDLLSHLAWQVGHPSRGAQVSLLGSEVIELLQQRLAYRQKLTWDKLDDLEYLRLEKEARAFLQDMLAAGLLVRRHDQDGRQGERELIQFGVHETLVPAWFKASRLLSNPRRRKQKIAGSGDDPFQRKWHLPLQYMASIWTYDRWPEEVERLVEHLLQARQVPDELERQDLPRGALYRVMPLGLMLCQAIFDDLIMTGHGAGDSVYRSMLEQIATEFRSFYEYTDYAVVTVSLQPWAAQHVAQLNELARNDLGIPETPDEVEAWIVQNRALDDSVYEARIDRIWRYQRRYLSFVRLVYEVESRFDTDSKPWKKLMRRLVFGMRFVITEDYNNCLDALNRIEGLFGHDPVVRAMARHTRVMLELNNMNPTQLRLRSKLEAEPDEPGLQEMRAWPRSEFFRSVRAHLYTMLRDREFADRVFEAAEHIFGCQGDVLVDTLTTILLDTDQNQWDRAAAALMLGRFLEARDADEIRTKGRYWPVILALTKVASSKDQFINVSACQLYDYAVWAIRCAFMREGLVEDISLPLLPGSEPPPE